MKTIFSCLFLGFCFWNTSALFAQVPLGINYQAIARDVAGNPIGSQSITVIFRIRQGSANGLPVYRGQQTLSTNSFGLFTSIIGQTGQDSILLSNISFGTNSHWLEVLIDPDAGGPKAIISIGTTPFLAVPYAIHSKTAATLIGGAITSASNGLTQNSSDVQLGGTLTTSTTISNNGFNLSIMGSGNIGVGTTNPKSSLEVSSSSSAAIRGVSSEQISNNVDAAQLNLIKARGTVGAPGALLANDGIGQILFGGFDGTVYQLGSSINSFASEQWNNTKHGSDLVFGTTKNGSTVNTLRLRIENTGNIVFNDAHLKATQATLPTSTFSGTGISGTSLNSTATDMKGFISGTGTLVVTQSAEYTLTYSTPYSSGSTPIVVITPANAASAKLEAFVASSTPTNFVINFTNNSGASIIAPSFYYIVIE